MLTLPVAVTLILIAVDPAAGPAPLGPGAIPPGPVAGSACPIPGWVGYCARIDDRQREAIRTSVNSRARMESPTCRESHDLLAAMLEDAFSQLWTFEYHRHDTVRTVVMGEAVKTTTGMPQGFGVRSAAFRHGSKALARVALHEAAHLAGHDESGAQWVERNCLG